MKMEKSKRQMALLITSQLVGKLVPATDWKFKAIMKMNESKIKELYEKSLAVMDTKITLDVGWEVALSALTPKIFKEIGAPGDW